MAKKGKAQKGKSASVDVSGVQTSAGVGRVKIVVVAKPWGGETIWADTERYVGKILHIKAGQELSVQYHKKKDETVYLLRGALEYRVGAALEDVQLKVGEALRIKPGTIHQMVALTDCEVLEVSTPERDDIVRLSDKYGREGTTAP
jgi:mannose-6-phosphate isomerase